MLQHHLSLELNKQVTALRTAQAVHVAVVAWGWTCEKAIVSRAAFAVDTFLLAV